MLLDQTEVAHTRWLEIGCGTGRFTSLMVERCDELITVDFANAMLRETRTRIGSVLSVQGDAETIPFKTATFDLVLSLNVVSHLVNWREALYDIARVLRPHGALICNFNNLSSVASPAGMIVNARGRAFRARVFSRWLRWDDVMESAAFAGLTLEARLGFFPLPTRTPAALVPGAGAVAGLVSRRAEWSPLPFVVFRKGVDLRTGG